MMPDELKNIHVQLDSETARQIADSYITYMYFETVLRFSMMAILLGGVALALGWALRRILSSTERKP